MNPGFIKPTASTGITLSRLRPIALMIALLCASACISVMAQTVMAQNQQTDAFSPAADQAMSKKLFAETPFEQWEKEGPARQIPWKVTASGTGLSFQQRLASKI